jgi:hypothetical protein
VTSGAVSRASIPSANTLISADRAVTRGLRDGGIETIETIETNAPCLVLGTSAV